MCDPIKKYVKFHINTGTCLEKSLLKNKYVFSTNI